MKFRGLILILLSSFIFLRTGISYGEIPKKLVGYSQVGSWTKDGWDYKRFLDVLAEYKMNYTRIFGIVPWYGGIMPWVKVEAGEYDLARFDEKYWSRLRDYVRYANSKGITVHLTLFDRCGMTDQNGWPQHPFNPLNNINKIRAVIGWHTFTSEQFKEIQKAYIVKAAKELKGLDIIFEVENEPFDNDEWHRWVIDILRNEGISNISINTDPFKNGYNWMSFHIKRLPAIIESGNFIYSDDGIELKSPDTLYSWAKEMLDNGGSYEHLSAENDIEGNMPPKEELRALSKAKSESEKKPEK